jgi:hypothetical protein
VRERIVAFRAFLDVCRDIRHAAAAAGSRLLRGHQPFLLARQSIRGAGALAQPAGVGIRIVPAHADDGMVVALGKSGCTPVQAARKACEQALRFVARRRRTAACGREVRVRAARHVGGLDGKCMIDVRSSGAPGCHDGNRRSIRFAERAA